MRGFGRRKYGVCLLSGMLLFVASPSLGQDRLGGQVATSMAGQAGRRQTREQAAAAQGTTPLARIDNRLRNRIQSRISSRIDRNYMPAFGASLAFDAAAAEQAR